ncbi:MAG: AAA family ATPase [Chitinophagaceae bacterium]
MTMLSILLLAFVLASVLPAGLARLRVLLQKLLQAIPGITFPVANDDLFGGSYIDARVLYTQLFREVPSISYMSNVDINKAFAYIQNGYAGRVMRIYQRNAYNWNDEQLEFDVTIFRLAGKTLIEVGNGYVNILYHRNNFSLCKGLVKVIKEYKAPAREREQEINIITFYNGRLVLKPLEIKPAPLDIDLYYNDDFKPVDTLIKTRLARENDKGIVLLHGLPGTGKTTYLRHLIGSLKKKVLFVSPGVAGNLMSPEFVDLLVDNPNAVLVIEDAENIIMDRKYNSNSSVSNLLNISDGLMSDCLNVQIVCTFNSALSMVDNALMRKGRLIARYEFGKLGIAKATKLAACLGMRQDIDQPMTLAEITNPDEAGGEKPEMQVIGFRSAALQN